MKFDLTIELLQKEAGNFAVIESAFANPALYGVTDGKAVGTYLEQKFKTCLQKKYNFVYGNAAKGIDFPELLVDIKVTSIRQPQSSCPFRSARQKIYGLGYSLLVFVYDKEDIIKSQKSFLHIKHVIFIESKRSADYQTTRGLAQILENDANIDDIIAFLEERMLPVDEIEAQQLAEEILKNRPVQGYLTISNALQWRLQYSRVIEKAGEVEGVIRVC